jgi:hypothetical protein
MWRLVKRSTRVDSGPREASHPATGRRRHRVLNRQLRFRAVSVAAPSVRFLPFPCALVQCVSLCLTRRVFLSQRLAPPRRTRRFTSGNKITSRSCSLHHARSLRRLPWGIVPSGDDDQTFDPCRLNQSSIERDERNRLSKLPLQVHAACELDGVARTKGMSEQQRTRICSDFRGHFHDDKRGYVEHERGQHPVALLKRERPLPGTTGYARRDLHLRKPTGGGSA